jgi:hypothetical protein
VEQVEEALAEVGQLPIQQLQEQLILAVAVVEEMQLEVQV